MNPLPAIQNACAKIDGAMGRYADEGKREVAWRLVRDLCEKWRPVTAQDKAEEAEILADAISHECPVPAPEHAPESGAMRSAIAECIAARAEIFDKVIGLGSVDDGAPAVVVYPKEAVVKIQGMCPNPRLMAGTLPDGRKVSVWTSRGRQFRIYADVPCKLDVLRGDEAIYLPT